MTETTPELRGIGDALEAAAARDLAAGPRRGRRRVTRRAAIAGVAVAAVLGGGAVAAGLLVTGDSVARSLPAGTFALRGTHPTCTEVRAGVEYRCTLDRAPAPEVSDWKGTVEPTVDDTKHVNGGCRGLNSEGTAWECYLGQEAVVQQIIGAGFLGEFAPAPGRG
jgi:hypothetical protein